MAGVQAAEVVFEMLNWIICWVPATTVKLSVVAPGATDVTLELSIRISYVRFVTD